MPVLGLEELRRGRDNSHENPFAVVTVVQILQPSDQPSEEPRTTASWHMVQKHGGQQLIQESVAQQRHLDRAACAACDTIRSRRCRRFSFCQSDTPLSSSVGATSSTTAQSSQPVPPGDLFDDSPLPHCLDIVRTEFRNGSPSLHSLSQRHSLARKPWGKPSVATSPGRAVDILAAARC